MGKRTTLKLTFQDRLRYVLRGGLRAAAPGEIRALVCFVLLQLLASCGGNAASSTGGTTPPPNLNPQPTIVSLSPSSASAAGPSFTLTITGVNFISSSTVQWNGSPRTTTYSSSSQLEAQISASDIASSGSAAVSVINPTPGGGNSGSAEFVIDATSNPAPSLASLSPSVVTAGTGSFLLTLNGSNFIPGSTIQWNGSVISSTYLSEQQLEAQIPAANVTTSGFADVTVVNPSPGGGVSSAVTFSISYGPIVVNQGANDLVWDSVHQLIYLSVPSLAAANGNTITAVDPVSGSIQLSQFGGSEPGRLAISDDGQFLYAGIDGASMVQRFMLPSLTPDINYLLGADATFGPYAAYDVEVAPGLAHTTAVSRGLSNLSSALGGMAIYDDAAERPNIAHDAGSIYDSLQWGSDTAIYANNGEITSFDFYVLAASSTGVVQTEDYRNTFSSFYSSIHYDGGTNLIYDDDGNVINPANGQNVGTFQASGLMIPDSTLNSAFFLGQTASQSGTPNFTIESFDLTTFAPVAEIVVPSVYGYPLHFIRWGTSGLAFNDTAGYIYILNGPFVTADGARVVTQRRYLSPVTKIKSRPRTLLRPLVVARGNGSNGRIGRRAAHSQDSNPVPTITALAPSEVAAGVSEFTLTVTGTNFLSLSAIQWNGSQLPTEYLSSSELQAKVSASDVATAGSVSVNVSTPSPGGGSSTTLPFTIVSNSPNPVPFVLSLYPDFVTAGSAGFTMNVNGSGFNASSVVEWNGSPRSALLYGTGQLQVQITSADVLTAGDAQITVSNAAPGGGVSNAAEFQILYQPVSVNQVTNDMVWDPLNQVIYISVPSSASTHPNQVCILNPVTAVIGICQGAGSEPDVLAISDDSQFLYVGEDGTGTVQRFTLPSLVPDISYFLGNYSNGVPYYAIDLQVAPGAPNTTAVSKGVLDSDPRALGGITIFDDSTPRPVSTAENGYPGGGLFASIQWGFDTTALYAANSETTGYDFYTLTVSSSGVALDQDYPEVFWNGGRIHYNQGTGLVYSDDGFHAIDPSTGLPAGIFEVGGGWPMAPDSTLNTVFILAKYVWQENANYTIDLFDMTRYVPVAHIPFSTVQNGLNQLGRFIRWGSNGLALNDTAGNLYLISGSFVAADHKSQTQANSIQKGSQRRTPADGGHK
jgi:hypothetical protein